MEAAEDVLLHLPIHSTSMLGKNPSANPQQLPRQSEWNPSTLLWVQGWPSRPLHFVPPAPSVQPQGLRQLLKLTKHLPALRALPHHCSLSLENRLLVQVSALIRFSQRGLSWPPYLKQPTHLPQTVTLISVTLVISFAVMIDRCAPLKVREKECARVCRGTILILLAFSPMKQSFGLKIWAAGWLAFWE